MKTLVWLSVVVCFLAGGVLSVHGQSADGWRICTAVTEFSVPIAGTDAVLRKISDRPACIEMDNLFFKKLVGAGFRGEKKIPAVEEWLQANTQLPHEHMLMMEIDAESRVLTLDFCK